jgi:hypothetical protein
MLATYALRSRRAQGRLLLLGLLGLLAAPFGAARAEGPAKPDIRDNFQKGAMHAGATVGYGHGFRFGSDADKQLSAILGDVRMATVIPRFGYALTGPIGGDSFLRGNIDMLVELAFLFNAEPWFGFGGGGGTSLRYNFLFNRIAVPYVEINLGLLGIDFDLGRQADGFAFNVGAGAGSHWRIGERTTLTTEIRWQHISNAYTKKPNDGINTMQFMLGVYRFF